MVIYRKLLIVSLALLFTLPAHSFTGWQPCAATAGTVERGSYRSEIAQTTMYYSVYTPPCYDSTTRTYPILYLMHGSNEDDGHWLRLGLKELLDTGISDGTLPPVIVALPFGEWIANQNQFDRVSWSTVFLETFMPLVEGRYRVDAERGGRAIGGISRGGFWAFHLAFRHPDLFSSVGGHSAFFDDYHAPPEYNPLRLAQTAPNLDTLRIWLDRGRDDYARQHLDLMHERLRQRGIAHEYRLYPEGQHNNAYWRQHVLDYLRFYTAAWQPTPPPAALPVMFATNTPASVITPPPAAPTPSGDGLALFLPAVSFPSLQAWLRVDRLQAIRDGQHDAKLTLDETTAAALRQLGISLSPQTAVVPDDALLNTLWRDRTRFTLLAFDRLSPRYRVLSLALDASDTPAHPLDLLDSGAEIYPFAFRDGPPNFFPDRLTRLLLSGVTALTRNTRTALDRLGVPAAASGIQAYTARVDFFHTSNEVSFSPGCPQSDEPPLGAFCSKQDHFELFDRLGLDIVELTGNHNNDYGFSAYLDTLAWYRERGIQTVGGGEDLNQAQQPLALEHHGNRIIMVACNWAGPYYALASATRPGAAPCDWNWFRAHLPALASDSDLLVVTVQHQEFEEYLPTPQQRQDFRGLADLGADVVIGTQAHKPQTMEFYTTARGTQAFLHYGLGNLFFDQPFWGNMRFFMDQLFIYDGRLLGLDLFTGIIDDLARPRPMTADEQFNFLAFMFNAQAGF